MSKRIANTRANTARNGRVRLSWRTIRARQIAGPAVSIAPITRTSRTAIARPGKSIWRSFKDLFRRTQSR